MKGLLLKDWYMLIKEVRFYLPFTVVYALIAVFTGMPVIFVMVNVMLGSMIVKSLMAREEINKWDSMAANLPVTKKELVAEKYVIGIFGTLASNIMSFLVLLFAQLALKKNVGMPLLPFFLIYAGFGIIYLAGELPVLFKFGTANGRIVFMAVVALMAGVSAGISSALSESAQSAGGVLSQGTLAAIGAGFILLSVLAAVVSVRLSVRFYQRREF